MPTLNYRHNMPPHADGSPYFIIRTPRPVSRTLLNVKFIDGEGRTKYEEKAKVFCDQFGYTVLLPEGHPGWVFNKPTKSSEPEKFEWEYNYQLVGEDGEEIEDIEE